MSSGSWGFSLGLDDTAPGRVALPRGVYQARPAGDSWMWEWRAPLPYVTEELIRRDGDGRRVSALVRITAGPDEHGGAVICDADEVRTGTWAERLGLALSADDKVIRATATALRMLQSDAAKRELTPGWTEAGTLAMPPADTVALHGWGQTAGQEATARTAWRELADIAARNPKMALVAGAALGGIYLSAVGGASFILHMTGRGRRGKSTTEKFSGALFGPVGLPGQIGGVIQPWNATKIGLGAELGDWGCLTAFRDELGVAAFTPRDLESLLLGIAQGNSRTRGNRLGGSTRTAPWQGVLISTGNDSLLGQITNEGLAARIIEIAAPFTLDAADSKQVEAMLPDCHGWPFAWLLAAPAEVASPATFRDRYRADALAALGGDNGGVEGTLRGHLAVAVAGAALLDTLLGTDVLRAAALTAADDVYAVLVTELTERGMTPADRLLNALMQSWASDPDRWPDLSQERLPPEFGGATYRRPNSSVLGFVMDPIPGHARLAVLTGHLPAIAAEFGMTSTLAALRELKHERHLLEAPAENRLQSQVRIREKNPRVYIVRLPNGDDDDSCPTSPTGNASDGPRPDDADGPPATPGQPADDTGSGGTTEPSCGPGSTTWSPTPPPSSGDGVLFVGPAGPVRLTDDPASSNGWGTCRGCGNPAPFADDLGPVHPGGNCWQPRPAQEGPPGSQRPPDVEPDPEPRDGPPEPVQAVSAPRMARPAVRTAPPPRGVGRNGHVLAALDASGLWFFGQDAPTPVETLPASRAQCVELAFAHGVNRLIVYPDVLADVEDFPQTMTIEDSREEKIRHPWAALDGTDYETGRQDPDGDDLIRPYSVIYRRDSHEESVVLCLAHLDPVFEKAPLPAPAELVAGHVHFRGEVGQWWFTAAPYMFKSLLERSLRRGKRFDDLTRVESIATGQIPAVGQTLLISIDARPLDDREDSAIFLMGFDKNAAWPTAMTSTVVGIGEPRHIAEAFTFNPQLHGKLAGYFRIEDDIPLDGRAYGVLQLGPGWLTTGEARMLARAGLLPTVVEAYVWEDSAELFKGFGKKIREARKALIARRGAVGVDTALFLLKQMANSQGALNPGHVEEADRDGLWRPDWYDQIKGQGQANIVQELLAIGAQRDRYPVAVKTDELVYATDHHDPAEAAAELGLTYDATGAAGNGWKSDGPVSLAAIRGFCGDARFWTMFRKLREEGK